MQRQIKERWKQNQHLIVKHLTIIYGRQRFRKMDAIQWEFTSLIITQVSRKVCLYFWSGDIFRGVEEDASDKSSSARMSLPQAANVLPLYALFLTAAETAITLVTFYGWCYWTGNGSDNTDLKNGHFYPGFMHTAASRSIKAIAGSYIALHLWG